jgi:glycosyltransferase involved in cell wall biosynthesis
VIVMGNRPRVSVIVPAHDEEEFLADAAGSVLGQTWKDLELIVVNDGSEDRTAELADSLARKDARVRVLHRKVAGGLSSARNAGIAAAAGELICFLDADDILLPDKLERQVTFLDRFPGCDLVFSDWYVGDGKLTPLYLGRCEPPRLPMREVLVYGTWFACMTALVRASLVERTGPFDESLRGAEDWDFWVRASGCGALSYLPGPVAVYRLHARQMHRDGTLMRNAREGVIRKHFKPGTGELDAARAAMAWREAVGHWERRHYAGIAASLLTCLWHARSPRTLRKVRLLCPV